MKVNSYDQQILRIALPAIITNITIPLLGLVDTAIVGHMGDAAYIGAIAVGSMMFNLVYWVFGFLRMGTSGMTAQARGRRDFLGACRLLTRACQVALGLSAAVLLFQWPLRELMLWLISPTADVRPLAVTYYNIVVWGAPASFALFALNGWFIGMQNSRSPMVVSILQNVTNILVSLLLVYALGMKVEGVALGTVIAQYIGLFMALFLLWRYYRRMFRYSERRSSDRYGRSFAAFFRVNRDIFLRTLFLVAVNLFFTAAGARQGATILAVNTLLIQLYLLFSYFMDGFAYAGEALGGRYWGARNMLAYHDVVRRLFGWGLLTTVLFTLVYVVGGMPFLQLLTDESTVVEASRDYVWWAWLIPVAGVAAFVWDGIFIGTTQTRGMLLSSLLASVVFFLTVWLLMPVMENHGLWLAMILYLVMRGVLQTVIYLQKSEIIPNSC
jgi:MATE family multidrug resistance protein